MAQMRFDHSPLPGVVEDLDRDRSRLGATPMTPIPLSAAATMPGDVGPVAVAVLRRPGAHAVRARGAMSRFGDEVRVGQVDARVEDRDADALRR